MHLMERFKFLEKNFNNCFSLNEILNEVSDTKKLIETELLKYPKFKINFLVQAEYLLKGKITL